MSNSTQLFGLAQCIKLSPCIASSQKQDFRKRDEEWDIYMVTISTKWAQVCEGHLPLVKSSGSSWIGFFGRLSEQ